MFCPKCGKKLPDGAKFCSICGTELKIIEKNSGKENSSANKKNAEQTKTPSEGSAQKMSAEGSVDSAARNRPLQSEQPSINSAQWYSDFREKVLEIVQYRWFKIAAVAVVVLIVVAVAAGVLFGGKGGLIASMNRFDPSKATETGTIQLNYGDTTHLDSIKSTLTFTEAEIENVDYDDLTLDIGWKFTLTPERKLNPDQEDLERSCETWLKKAEYSGNNGASWFGLDEIDYNENCITYYVAATVGYAETVDKLTCQAGDDLSIELNYSIPINAEEILLTRGDNYMRDGNYAEALNTYQMISSPEAERKVRAIECIDFADDVTKQLIGKYALASIIGYNFSFYYEPESYTYYQVLTFTDFWNELAGAFSDSGRIDLNGATLQDTAEDIFFDFFYPNGFSDITCVVMAKDGSGEIYEEYAFSGLDYISEDGSIDQAALGDVAYYRDFQINGSILEAYIGNDQNVIVPDGIINIGNNAFYENENVVSVSLPESVQVISAGAFAECKNLKEINLPEGLQTIGRNAFYDCKLQSLDLPSSIEEIGDYAFSFNKISSFSIGTGIRTIPSGVWDDFSATQIIVPDGVETIESNAFIDMRKVTYLYLPASLTEIKSNGFGGSIGQIEEVVFGGTKEQWRSIKIAENPETSGNRLFSRVPIVCSDGTIPVYIDDHTNGEEQIGVPNVDPGDYDWIEGEYLMAHLATYGLQLAPGESDAGEFGVYWSLTDSSYDQKESILIDSGFATYIGGGILPHFSGTFTSTGDSLLIDYDGYNFVVTCAGFPDGGGTFFRA